MPKVLNIFGILIPKTIHLLNKSILQIYSTNTGFELHCEVGVKDGDFYYLLDIYTQNRYNKTMIKNFADKETEKIYKQIFSKKLPQSIQRIALRKLIMIDNAGCLEDLRVPPANHLELLQGARAGQYSIRINDQYRICFTINGKDFLNVEIVDYH